MTIINNFFYKSLINSVCKIVATGCALWVFSGVSFAEGISVAQELKPATDVGEVLTLDDISVDAVEVIDENILIDNNVPLSTPILSKLDLLTYDGVGVLTPETGGVNLSYWSYRSYQNIKLILTKLNFNTVSMAYNRSLRRIVLSETTIPEPEDSSLKGSIIRIRVDSLIKAGRFKEAKLLINRIEEKVRIKYFSKELVSLGLIEFDNLTACSTLYAQDEKDLKKPFWQITDLICSTIAGDTNSVERRLNQIDSYEIALPSGIKELVLYRVYKKEFPSNVKIDLNIWSVNLMRLSNFGVQVPENLDDIFIKRGLLLNLGVDAYERIKIAEEIFANDGLSVDVLHSVYYSLPDDYELVTSNKNNDNNEINILPRSYIRAISFKSLIDKSDKELVKSVLAIIADEKDYDQRILSARIFTSMLKNVTAFEGKDGVRVARLFYAVGDYDNAKLWTQVNEDALWFESSLLEPIPTPINPIVFVESGGIFETLETPITENNGTFLDSLFGNRGVETISHNVTTEKVIYNDDALAQNTSKRRKWMQYLVDNEPIGDKGSSGLRMAQAFLMLEAIGYDISDASWMYASRHSVFSKMRVISPAKIRALNTFVNNTKDPINVLLVVKDFINQTDLDDIEMAKVMSVLYRAGYPNIVRDITYERAIYHNW